MGFSAPYPYASRYLEPFRSGAFSAMILLSLRVIWLRSRLKYLGGGRTAGGLSARANFKVAYGKLDEPSFPATMKAF